MTEIERLYQSIEDKKKLGFLLEILQKDEKTKKIFLERFFQEWEALRLKEPLEYDIPELLKKMKDDAKTIAEELNELDFENLDWDMWDNPGYYVPDYEVAQTVAEEMADQSFEGLIDSLEHEIEFGDLTTIVSNLVSVLHGIGMSEIHDPEYNLSDDSKYYFFDKITDLLKNNQEKLQSRKLLAKDFEAATQLFLDYQQTEKCTDDLLPTMVHLYIAIIQNKEQAGYFWQKCTGYKLPISNYPDLVNHVVSLLENKELWVKTIF